MFTGTLILKSFDIVIYTCAEGYSTDGTISKESKQFSLECEASGVWSRSIKKQSECQPVRCDSFQLPAVPFTHILEVKKKCQRVKCGAPEVHKYSTRSSSRSLFYGQSATYRCFYGYTVDGYASGASTYVAKCKADGTMTYFAGKVELTTSFLMTQQPTPPASKAPAGPTPPAPKGGDICQPVSCGPLPSLKYTSFEPAVQGEVFYCGESFVATCDKGYTVG